MAARPLTDDWLLRRAEASSSEVALVEESGLARTWADVARAAGALAATMTERGAGPGERVALVGGPTGASVVAVHATVLTGATLVPVDPRLRSGEIGGTLGLARPLLTLQTEDTTVASADGTGAPTEVITADVWKRTGAASREIRQVERPDDDDLVIVSTSGTTGAPRGVRLTRAGTEASALAVTRRLGVDASDRWQLTLPLAHVGGLAILWRSVLVGFGVVLAPGSGAGAHESAAADGHGVTVASLVPTQLARLLQRPVGHMSGLKVALIGGAGADPDLLRRACDAGIPALGSYGMTEMGSTVAIQAPGDPEDTSASPIDGVVVQIAGPDGAQAPPGTRGRICVGGPMLSPGYAWPEEEALPRTGSGLFRTGDEGAVDAGGRLHVHGRIDDVIVVGGENVHPTEIERVLHGHPDVVEALVSGEPDAEYGTVPVAVVVLRPDVALDPESLSSYCRRSLPGIKVPRRWTRVDSLPRTRLGKVRRDTAIRLAGGT